MTLPRRHLVRAERIESTMALVPSSRHLHHRNGWGAGELGCGQALEGAMIYKFVDGCEGWIVENQTFIRFQYEEGRSLDSFWTYVG